MVDFTEKDLFKTDYINTVTDEDNPDYTAIHDQERVSKKEKFEVVYFCDQYVKNNAVPKTKASFQKVEKLIGLSQASSIVMRDKLNDYVKENWDKGLV